MLKDQDTALRPESERSAQAQPVPMEGGASSASLTYRRILKTWWPLAASWMLMGAELPVLSAVVARLAQPEINLAAYGGVVFPLALIVESPIVMLLATSTALSKDWGSYLKIRRFMMTAGAVLTAVHLLIALTPLYYFVTGVVIGAPPEIIEPARMGLIIMTPWTWSIAYRRFNQGVLIRFGHSHAVGVGTAVRLTTEALVLATGYLLGTVPGVIVATSAVATGVVSEALYVGWRVRPVIEEQLKPAPPADPVLTLSSFLRFYVPLVMTSLLTFLAQPIGSSAISRMPEALVSLAVWPVVSGLIFLLRSVGVAYNEVVVALLDEKGSAEKLYRLALILTAATTAFLLLVVATPAAQFWFADVSALPPALVSLARRGLWLAVLMPGLSVLQSWYQGNILYSRRTGSITQSVVVYLLVSILVLSFGVAWGRVTGLYMGVVAMVASLLAQTAWLWYRSRPAVRAVRERDAYEVSSPGD